MSDQNAALQPPAAMPASTAHCFGFTEQRSFRSQDFGYIIDMQAVLDKNTGTLIEPETFDQLTGLSLATGYPIAAYDSLTFVPGGPREIFRNGGRLFNLCEEAIAPTPGRTAELHLVLLQACGGDYLVWQDLLDAVAFLIQNPGKRLKYLMMIESGDVSAAQAAAQMLAAILGACANTYPNAQALNWDDIEWVRRPGVQILSDIEAENHGAFDRLATLLRASEFAFNVSDTKQFRVRSGLNAIAFRSSPKANRRPVFTHEGGYLPADARTALLARFDDHDKHYMRHELLHRNLEHFNDPTQPVSVSLIGSLNPADVEALGTALRKALSNWHDPMGLTLDALASLAPLVSDRLGRVVSPQEVVMVLGYMAAREESQYTPHGRQKPAKKGKRKARAR